MVLRTFFGFCALFVALLFSPAGQAQGPRYREEPLPFDRMEAYKEISFSPANFAGVTSGMTQEQVLSLLGRPSELKKERRRHGRWTVHYLYPEGHVVNFRDGLVVGKEKR